MLIKKKKEEKVKIFVKILRSLLIRKKEKEFKRLIRNYQISESFIRLIIFIFDYIHSNERIFVIILWKEIFGSCGIYNFYQILTEYSNFRGSSFKIY